MVSCFASVLKYDYYTPSCISGIKDRFLEGKINRLKFEILRCHPNWKISNGTIKSICRHSIHSNNWNASKLHRKWYRPPQTTSQFSWGVAPQPSNFFNQLGKLWNKCFSETFEFLIQFILMKKRWLAAFNGWIKLRKAHGFWGLEGPTKDG